VSGNPLDPVGEPEGTVFDPGALNCNASLVLLVKGAADALEREYPGWLWAIQPDELGGVINIFSMRLSGQWGYTLKTSRVQEDARNAAVLKAGGELLERFGFRPGPYDADIYRATLRHLGQMRADVSDLPARTQREYNTNMLQNAVATGHARILMDADIAKARHVPGD
jgi:hypothetical protein